MRPLSLRITFELILGVVLIASLVMILRQYRRIAESQRRQEADAQTMRLLREALRQVQMQKLPPPVTEVIPDGSERAGIAKREAVIERLDRELAENRTAISDLQTQLAAMNEQNTKSLASAEEKLQKQQADSQAEKDDLQKKLAAAQDQSDIARQRMAALEADNSKLRADSSGSSTRAAEVARTVASLQDLERRRDLFLTSILRRYRDITGDERHVGQQPRRKFQCVQRSRLEPHSECREFCRRRHAPTERVKRPHPETGERSVEEMTPRRPTPIAGCARNCPRRFRFH